VARDVWTVVVAAGSGSRFGAAKQFEDLGGRRVVDWSLAAAHAVSDGVVLVVPAGHSAGEAGNVVAGGKTRSESVRNGLAAVPDDAEVIVVHDAARPFASVDLFLVVIEAIRAGADGAVPGVPVTDTIKQVDGQRVVTTLARERLVAVQTPQAFRASALRRAHATATDATDDAALVEALGGTVVVVPGEASNQKITVADDLAAARRALATPAR
jgi:2-C-methyl-D-erythritol 4-phosphate cytidylyltransferase